MSELLFGASTAWKNAGSQDEQSSDAWLVSNDAWRSVIISAAQMVADEVIANRMFQSDEVLPLQPCVSSDRDTAGQLFS